MRSDNSIHLVTAARQRHELARAKALAALHELDAPASPSLSAPSPTPQASPVPGSTLRPTSKTRSGACAPATSPGRPQRFRPGNSPATNPCASASTSRYAATANSPTKTSGYAANSLSFSARTEPRHPTPHHIAIG